MNVAKVLKYGDEIIATIYAFLEENDCLHLFPKASTPKIAESVLWRNPESKEAKELQQEINAKSDNTNNDGGITGKTSNVNNNNNDYYNNDKQSPYFQSSSLLNNGNGQNYNNQKMPSPYQNNSNSNSNSNTLGIAAIPYDDQKPRGVKRPFEDSSNEM